MYTLINHINYIKFYIFQIVILSVANNPVISSTDSLNMEDIDELL